MNYAWARDFTLELINQYSIAGGTVALSYNNQADYVARIPKLLDDAQVSVATTARRIRCVKPVSDLDMQVTSGMRVYKLPEDCWQMAGTGLIYFADGDMRRYGKCRMLDDRSFAVPETAPPDLSVEYFRYPKLLGTNPQDSAELDNTTEVQMALPYYAAAHLVMYDNNFAYAALFNEWEGKLERLYELPKTEQRTVEDVYAGQEWGDGT